MDLVTFFLSQHAAVHAKDVSGRAFSVQRVFEGLSDDQMRLRPGKGLNSLVWLLWHIARTEDAAVNPVVAGRDQVLEDEWMRRMNVPWRIIGTGMTEAEVTEMSARADVGAARRGVGRDRGPRGHQARRRDRRVPRLGRGRAVPVARLDPGRPARELSAPSQRRAHRRGRHGPRTRQGTFIRRIHSSSST